MTDALFDAQFDSPTKEGRQEKQEHEQCPQSCIQIQGRMNNLETRYLNQDQKLDAILARQSEYWLDMKTFQEQMATELQKLKDGISTFDKFSWFIETVNKWRNNLFWGVAKLVIVAVCLLVFATNCESMKSTIKRLIIGV